ncbi:MAG: hypothetical protein RIB45_15625 [Marivibrio sp.]|uniref:hypothetical protein n=1 Tax=Marivibrio sp. TaxID=2039719 RepID=UPI0032EED3D6
MSLSEIAAGYTAASPIARSAAPVEAGRLAPPADDQFDVQLAKKRRPGFVEDTPALIFEPLRQGLAAETALAAGAQQRRPSAQTPPGAQALQDVASQALQARRAYGGGDGGATPARADRSEAVDQSAAGGSVDQPAGGSDGGGALAGPAIGRATVAALSDGTAPAGASEPARAASGASAIRPLGSQLDLAA